MRAFYSRNKSVLLHFFGFFLSIAASFMVLWRLSKVDLFDFFNILYQLVSVTSLTAIIVLIFTTIILFVENKKNRKALNQIRKIDAAHFEIAENNRDELKADIHEIKGLVKNMNLTLKVRVFNHIALQDKLILVLQSINYNRDKAKNAIFISFFEKVVKKVSLFVRTLKKDEKRFDYEAKKDLIQELENLCLYEDIDFDLNSFLELSKTLMNEYSEVKKDYPQMNSADIISDKFKILVEATYEDYTHFHSMILASDVNVVTRLIKQYKEKLIFETDPTRTEQMRKEIERLQNIQIN